MEQWSQTGLQSLLEFDPADGLSGQKLPAGFIKRQHFPMPARQPSVHVDGGHQPQHLTFVEVLDWVVTGTTQCVEEGAIQSYSQLLAPPPQGGHLDLELWR